LLFPLKILCSSICEIRLLSNFLSLGSAQAPKMPRNRIEHYLVSPLFVIQFSYCVNTDRHKTSYTNIEHIKKKGHSSLRVISTRDPSSYIYIYISASYTADIYSSIENVKLDAFLSESDVSNNKTNRLKEDVLMVI
jgi:hypothetical protein